jgi:immune inhibitor A
MKTRKWLTAILTLCSFCFAGLALGASGANDAEAVATADGIDFSPGLPAKAVPAAKQKGTMHDLPHPLETERRALRKQALEQLLQSQGAGGSGNQAKGKVIKLPKGQYVELAREGEDLIWTVLGEFGDTPSPVYGGIPGPQRNQIPQPDANNNTTIWRSDFNRDYYLDILFNDAKGANSMRNFYKEQSSGRYAVDGDVTDWVQVPYNTAHYGLTYPDTWFFIQDTITGWYDAQIAAGMTPEDIDEYLAPYDVWDRYDQDGDGDFNEPDGYIDHFQAVHAGEGEEAGGGAYGSEAIWSHRWYVQLTPIGAGGPTLEDGTVVPYGGTRIGGSRFWIGDYTIEPENGGVGVFAHEFGHDLGLPDLYNTAGGPSNSTGWWTLMSGGSWGSNGTVDIGSMPTHMGAWEKFQLGWLDYEVAFSGEPSDHRLGPAAYNSRNAQGLFVIAPDKEVLEVPFAYDGDYLYYSGSGDNLENAMVKTVSLPVDATLSAKANFDIEQDWDYAYLLVCSAAINGCAPVETSLSTDSNPNGQNFGHGITGSSDGEWLDLTADLSAFGGTDVDLVFYYWTDAFVSPAGLMLDAIEISGQPFDCAESDAGWTFYGFSVLEGGQYGYYFNAYVAEVRQYRGYDAALQTGPYVFGYGHDPALWNLVDHFPYQDGLLISYWDGSQVDNNTVNHPGEGLILPIDAHPEPLHLDPNIFGPNATWWSSIQSFDSPFSLQPTDSITLHYFGFPTTHPSLPGVAEFDANKDWWTPAQRYSGVNPPKSDTIIRVKSGGPKSSFMEVEVR